MYPHRIRLRGPWECEQVAEAPGRLRYRRRFGYPGRIDGPERVWLTFTDLPGSVHVELNGESLGERSMRANSFELEVTSRLRPRNVLVVEIDGITAEENRGEVALEVRCTAFLRGLRAWSVSSRLHVAGELVGTWEGTLELYVLAERSTVSYSVLATAGRFQIVSEPLAEVPARIIVELVNAAVVWYQAEIGLA